MATLGQKLRQERERLGIPLSDIARETRISARYLEAIEAEDTQTLPQDFFYRSFVRQYAEYLGISAEEVTVTMRREVPVEPQLAILPQKSTPSPTILSVPTAEPVATSQSLSTSAIFEEARTSKKWLAVAALLLVGSVSYLATRRASGPLDTAPPASGTTAGQVQPATPPATTPQLESVQTAQASNPVSSAVVQATDLGSGRLQIVISAREQTWIKLTADGKDVYVGLIEPGQSQAIQNASNAELLTGNAGGIEVKQNGRPLPGLGSSGEVRTVVFDTDNYQVRQPVAKPKVAEPTPPSPDAVKPAETTSTTE